MSIINGLASSSLASDLGAGVQNFQANRPPAAAPAKPYYQGALDTANANIQNTAAQVQPVQVDPNALLSLMPNLAGAGPAGTQPQPSPVQGMQNGGVVRRNMGKPQVHPEFQRGPAIPVGPNDTVVPVTAQAPQAYAAGGVVSAPALPAGPQTGIVPASTEGQVLTMADGGGVPGEMGSQPFINPMGPSPPMIGRAAGLASGLAQGQVMGTNLVNAWHQHQAREALADASAGAESASGISEDQPQPGGAVGAVEHFFHHVHGALLGEDHMPNAAGGQPGQYPVTGTASPHPGQPTPVPAQGGAQSYGINAPNAPPAMPVQTGAPTPGTPSGVPMPAAGQIAPGGPPPAAGASAQPPPNTQTQATVSAVAQGAQQAKADQAAVASGQGLDGPAQQPGAPHSLTPDWWQHSEQLKMKAMRQAALAGQNPLVVGQSLDAIRTSAIQGQSLRWLSAANTALLNGDDKSLKQALSNVNYYLPNGQGMTFKTATAQDAAADQSGNTKVGQLMFRNPMAGLYGHEGESEFVGVTPQYIQLLGQNMLDPMNVQQSILGTYSAQMKARQESQASQGALLTGKGRQALGQAALNNSDIKQKGLAVQNYIGVATGNLRQAQANRAQAQANQGGFANRNSGMKVTQASVLASQKAADAAVTGMVLGPQVVAPGANDPNNLNPAAGRVTHDQTNASPLVRGMSADQVDATRGIAQHLAGSNQGIYGPQESADAAARIVRYGQTKSTHPDPATHKPTPDVIYDKGQGTVHVWVGNGYRNFYLQPNIVEPGIPGGGEGEGGSTGAAEGEGESPEQTAGGDAFNSEP